MNIIEKIFPPVDHAIKYQPIHLSGYILECIYTLEKNGQGKNNIGIYNLDGTYDITNYAGNYSDKFKTKITCALELVRRLKMINERNNVQVQEMLKISNFGKVFLKICKDENPNAFLPLRSYLNGYNDLLDANMKDFIDTIDGGVRSLLTKHLNLLSYRSEPLVRKWI